ncbi:substrate-binding domain-containing protein [Gillisia sp. Q332]|uniref:substrate-binding domain-containing protein n=1 Tax=Gillisia xinjiangensis TaxID=3384765 RepID=UPI00391C10F8
MQALRIGGVPEHFNLPWHLCLEEGDFSYEHLDVTWKDFPSGTGAMNAALRNNEIDIAIILTEGIVKDIHDGNPSKIIQTYVESPLIWGIHVSEDSKYTSLEELEHTKAAISRPGSGSQLMAYVNAKNQGWDLSKLEFEVVGTIEGAVNALKLDTAQYFLWEHFTTKPLVDRGVFRRVADCPTPWPCFMIAASDEVIRTKPLELRTMLDVINAKTTSFKEIPDIVEILAKRYGQKLRDIKTWLDVTAWSQYEFTKEELEKVQNSLLDLDLIAKKLAYKDIFHSV